MKVIIAAAGTAGHINPGLSIANTIKKNDPTAQIIFVGTKRGLENDLVPRAGYELKTIEAYGITLSNTTKAFKILKGYKQAKSIIKEFKPDIVIGTGGYICGPVLTEASKMNIPTMLHESNAFPGKAVKFLAKHTNTILVAFEDAKNRIEGAKKIVVTGTPTKINKLNLTETERNNIIKNVGLNPQKPILLVFGGSQGAKKINDAMIELIKEKMNSKYQIIWAAGPKQYDGIKEELEKANININNIKNTKIVPYIYNMEEVMNVSDVILARSGAMTITEISNLGKPSILIPLPNVSHNHQLYNAKVLENIGAAKIILNDELEAKKLSKEIEDIILNKNKVEEMGKKALEKSTTKVEEKIYEEIKKLVK